MHKALLLVLLAAALATSDAFDSEEAKNVINALETISSLHSQGVTTTGLAPPPEEVLAATFAENAGAFDFAGPAVAADPIWDLLGEHLNNNITVNLLGKALDILLTNGTIKAESLKLAIHIIGTYISYPGAPPEDLAGMLTSPHECGQKLLGLLFQFKTDLLAGNYMQVLLGCMDIVIKGPKGPVGWLGACQPDVPAVMLALASLRCPSDGFLVYPINNGASTGQVTCTPSAGDTGDESSTAALLGGALISQLVLSKYPIVDYTPYVVKLNRSLQHQAKMLSYAMVRMAFAALQTKDYDDCMQNLIKYELRIPRSTAPLPDKPTTRIGPLTLNMTEQGKATLCSAVAMKVWKPDTPKNKQLWASSTMVQAVVNVWLAIGKAMHDKAHVSIPSSQRFILCDTMSQVLRFKGTGTAVYDMFMPDQYQCMLNSKITSCPPDNKLPPLTDAKWFVERPTLKPDLSSTYFACNWLIKIRLAAGG